jgi:hypothetical protein
MAHSPGKTNSSLEERDSVDPPQHTEKQKMAPLDDLEGVAPDRLNAIFENPLAGISREDLMRDVTDFCTKFNLTDHLDDFKKGALVSQNPFKIAEMPELTEDDRYNLTREVTNKWSQPWPLYWLASK